MTVKNFEDFPDYVAAREKLIELQLKGQEVENKINGKLRLLEDLTERNVLDDCAQALIDGQNLDEIDKGALTESVGRLRKDNYVITRAIEMQRRFIGEMETRLSKEICEPLIPEYAAIVKRTWSKIEELLELIDEEADFINALVDSRLSFVGTIPRHNFRKIGTLNDDYSFVSYYKKEGLEHGYL